MKQFIKVLALILALVLAIGVLAACGDKKSDDDKTTSGSKDTKDAEKVDGTKEATDTEPAETNDTEIKGETETWGRYTVFVPEGYALKGGDAFDENNEKSFNLNGDEGFFNYFMFNLYNEDSAKMSVETTKESNEGAEDVEIEFGGVKWIGVAYESMDIPCFSMYADFGNDEFVLVSGASNAYDSDLVNAVLSSIVVAPAE